MSHLYVPSGKYPPYAPIIFIPVLFITTGISGYFYGLWCSSGFVHIIAHPYIIAAYSGVILIFMFLNGIVVNRLVRILKIRNPTLVRRWVWCAALPGWGISWLIVYLDSGTNLGFQHFVVDRLFNVVPAILSSQPGWSGFSTLTYYSVAPSWLLEAVVLPFFVGQYARCCAFLLFSEKKDYWWHDYINLPEIMHFPDCYTMIRNAKDHHYNWVELASAQNHFNTPWYYLNPSLRMGFFYTECPRDNWYFGWARTAGFDDKFGASAMVYWVLTKDQVEVLINKFDPKKESGATELLHKWGVTSIKTV